MAKLRELLAGTVAAAALGIGIAGCGDDGTKTVTEETPQPQDTATTPADNSSSSDPLSGINPPSGSKQLADDSQDGYSYYRYSTSATPKSVENAYKQEFSDAGWTIVQSGGSGGGWGPYGGSEYGLTAKRDDVYADVQAGGEKSGTTYFEVCAGDNDREVCNRLAHDNDTDSGGSGNGSKENHTKSGGS